MDLPLRNTVLETRLISGSEFALGNARYVVVSRQSAFVAYCPESCPSFT